MKENEVTKSSNVKGRAMPIKRALGNRTKASVPTKLSTSELNEY